MLGGSRKQIKETRLNNDMNNAINMDFYLTRAFLVSFVRCCLRDNKVRGKGSVSWKIGKSN